MGTYKDSSQDIHRHDLVGCLRKILTPHRWKAVHAVAGDFDKKRSRWRIKPLLVVALGMALDEGRKSMAERFEYACKVYCALFPKRRRCGRSLSGFLVALQEVPPPIFETLQHEITAELLKHAVETLQVGRWMAVGGDGSKQNLPRTDANAEYFGLGGKAPGQPQRLLVNVVALRSELLLEWAEGEAKASERTLLAEAVGSLAAGTLVVVDAGFTGFDWIQQMKQQKKHLLMRVGANVNLWARKVGAVKEKGGEIWLWPDLKGKQPPLLLRLIRICRRVKRKLKKSRRKGKGCRMETVYESLYLLTDVMDEKSLTKKEAQKLFELRWPANEGMFRNWKRSMNCEQVHSRTPETARGEFVMSLIAYQLMQVLVLWTRKRRRCSEGRTSIATALRVWGRATRALLEGKTTRWFMREMSEAIIDGYDRRGPKSIRSWPRRKKHKPFKPPKIRRLPRALESKGERLLEEEVA